MAHNSTGTRRLKGMARGILVGGIALLAMLAWLEPTPIVSDTLA